MKTKRGGPPDRRHEEDDTRLDRVGEGEEEEQMKERNVLQEVECGRSE